MGKVVALRNAGKGTRERQAAAQVAAGTSRTSSIGTEAQVMKKKDRYSKKGDPCHVDSVS